MFALFANSHYWTAGGQGDLRLMGSLERCLAADLGGFDWAEIVDLRTGALTLQKQRHTVDVSLDSVQWDSSGHRHRDFRLVEADMPTVWRATLSPEESRKFEALGAEDWLRGVLANAPEPEQAPVPPKALRFLRSIKRADLPLRADDQAEQVFVLRQAGLVDAEVHLHEVPGQEWARVLQITEVGEAWRKSAQTVGLEQSK